MPSRRQFLQAGLAASVLPRSATIGPDARFDVFAPVPVPPPRRSHWLYRIVADDRFAHSNAFGAAAERLGIERVRIAGDITNFWYRDLSLRWKTQRVAIAGLTAHGPLFCLEHLAWDHGLRVVFRGVHQVLASGEVRHSLSGPSDTIDRVEDLLLDGHWPETLAHVLAGCAVGADVSSTVVCSARVLPAGGAEDVELHEPLVSWVIAPRSSA